MPHLPANEYAKQVGQDKPVHEITELFTRYYGAYQDPIQRSAKPSPAMKKTPAPFVLKK